HSKSTLDKVQSVTNLAPYAIVLNPSHQLVHAALIHQVFDQTADGIIGQRGIVGGLEAETAFQSAGDVVFASAFKDFEMAGGCDAVIAGIETQHDFAKAKFVPAALGFGFDSEHGIVN